ncbi:MAG: hypothetical protein HFF50_06330 [Lawsonibacter sp.]|nr:hypothetical protein [Lawsonibacter sp.]
MKQEKYIIPLVIGILALTLAVYLGVSFYNAFDVPYATTLAYSYTANDSVEAVGLLAREELVLSQQAGIVDLTRSEGEKVGAHQTVALIYRDGQAQSDQAELDALDLEIELLEYAIADSGSMESGARLDQEILQSVVALRASAAQGDYTQLEDQIIQVKSSVLRRGYTYGDGLTAADLSALLRDLKSQRSALNQRASSSVTRVTAPQSGTFSSLTDGYESLLSPDSVLQLTPSALDSLMKSPQAGEDALGKLILGARWYFAAIIPAQAAERLEEGDTALLRFTGEFSRDLQMRVDKLGPREGERALAVFSTDRFLSQTTQLRQQTAELIFQDYSGLRIPKESLHLEKQTEEPDSSADASQAPVETTRLGVYALVNGRAEFKPVEIILEGTDYYVVQAANNGNKALRAGDEIIIRAAGLYDGQLLEF